MTTGLLFSKPVRRFRCCRATNRLPTRCLERDRRRCLVRLRSCDREAQNELSSALTHHYKGTAFKRNRWPLALAVIAGAGALGFSAALAANPALLIALACVLLLALFAFFKLMPAYTREGRKVQDHIEGLRQYLGVAERDDLARMKAPEMTPVEFARMLPYALALDVEKTWADRFAAVLGSVSRRCGGLLVLRGRHGSWGSNSTDGLTDSFGALDSTVSSASTAPGSESGSSGGGGDRVAVEAAVEAAAVGSSVSSRGHVRA